MKKEFSEKMKIKEKNVLEKEKETGGKKNWFGWMTEKVKL